MQNIDYYRDGFEVGYLKGMKQTYEKICEHCRNGHLVQNQDNRKEWVQCCFLLETREFNLNEWKCCYDRCPVIKGYLNFEETNNS